MSQPSVFNIPGLGFAKPNEKLPPAPGEAAGETTPDQAVPDQVAPDHAAPDPIPAASNQPPPLQEKHLEASVESKPGQIHPNQPADIDGAKDSSQPIGASTATPTAMQADAVHKVEAQPPPENAGSPAPLTRALELAIGFEPMDEDVVQGGQSQQDQHNEGEEHGQEENENEHPEWEVDSSPYESSVSSSSESSSSDSDSDSDSKEEDGYDANMGIEETVQMLMMEGSDDEGERLGTGKAQARTKNEADEEILPKPDVTITPEMKTLELGDIQHIIDNTIVIRGSTTGEYQVLDTGSVVCKADRSIVAAIAETLGQVQNPRYAIRLPSVEAIQELGLEVGSTLYYAPDLATYVFTDAIKAAKGSDASNLHDEEVAEHEQDYSDDEKEQEAKRRAKSKRKHGRDTGHRPISPPRSRNESKQGGDGLNYDDDEDDGPYRPLARPSDFGSRSAFIGNQTEPPPLRTRQGRGNNRGRGQRGGRRGAPTRGPRDSRGGGYRDSGHGRGGRRNDGRIPGRERGSPHSSQQQDDFFHSGFSQPSMLSTPRQEPPLPPQVQNPAQLYYQSPNTIWQQHGLLPTGQPGGFSTASSLAQTMPQMPFAGQQTPASTSEQGTFFNPALINMMAQMHQNAHRQFQTGQQQQQPAQHTNQQAQASPQSWMPFDSVPGAPNNYVP